MAQTLAPARTGIYGAPPGNLTALPPAALQYSPLIPGAAELEAEMPETLASFAMLVPPATLERRYALAQALRALAPGATLVALGPKDKGGARIRKELEGFGCVVEEESRAHHKICHCVRPAALTGIEEALTEGGPRFDARLGLWTQPGVFSWDRLDPGCALLLSCLPGISAGGLKGTGADFGAGLGHLAKAAFGSAKIEKITLLELDRRALSCARRNLEGEGRASYLQADLRSADLDRAGVRGLDFALMNPPFHDAGLEDRSLGLKFLAQAAHALKPGAPLYVVANRHLPYEELLAESFQHVERLREDNAFKVYRAER